MEFQLNDTDTCNEMNEYNLLYNYEWNSGINIEKEIDFINFNKNAISHAQGSKMSGSTDILLFPKDREHENQSCGDSVTMSMSSTGHSYTDNETFSLPRYLPPKTDANTFQVSKEPRMKYLVRSIRLWQEFTNSGDMDKLKVSFDDILPDDCMVLNGVSPPLVGRDKIFEQKMSLNRNIPDYCVFYSNIVHSKKRLITITVHSFGTFAYKKPQSKSDRMTTFWYCFEELPIEKLDEHHKIQKQKYDLMKSRNEVIRFEKHATWHFILSRNLKSISKMMVRTFKIDIY